MGKKYAFASSLIYFIVVCIFVTIRMLNHFHLFSFLGEYGSYIVNGVLQVGVLFFFSIFMFKFLTKRSLKKTLYNFSYTKISFRVILISIALGVVVYFLNIFVASFFNAILSSMGYEFASSSSGGVSIWSLILGLIFTAILPAICEENLHRGMLLFGNSGLGMKNNIIVTGLMFGLLHMNIEQFFYATIIGIFLNFVLYITESIYPSMIIHFMNNGIGVLLSYLTRTNVIRGGIFYKLSEITASNAVLGFVVMFIIVLILVFLLIYLVTLLIKYSFEDGFKAKQKAVQQLSTRVNFFNDIEKIKYGDEKSENESLSVEENLAFLSLDDLKEKIRENPENFVVQKPKREKMETRTKILLIASIVLMSAITLFTFIWGLL